MEQNGGDDAPETVRVLYIDDDSAFGRLVEKTLQRRGRSVVHAVSGDEGLALLGDAIFDVIALDHEMPGETGFDILQRLGPRSERPPVIYVTGHSDVRVAVLALKSGADDYVIKDLSEDFYDLLDAAISQSVERARLRRMQRENERAIREARDRAEILLREVNHRVANSLGLVAAMVRMQAATLKDPGAVEALRETQARISAVGGVHRRLYTSGNVGSVELDDYLKNLLGELQASLEGQHKSHPIVYLPGGLSISTDKAVSLGVIVSELVTNAFKYAYREGEDGDIRVRLSAVDDQRARVSVEDDGIGYTEQTVVRGTGIGSKIVDAMAVNMQATVGREPVDVGTHVVVEFPL
ncbi:Transcriptional regulatory protein AfsQ1 [Hartmannibacter diazotrophicus]|uniref:histidine kinase n=1 Tax=Hartmannibacter diazotrophicus TaxID=1482074 RepID=A0A2C9D785_9HYPH|nr:response regulator [Hartmannibacter diazotrophicus]SON56157.1 Transcriptional regulatory protein AfsQ1 [Hartmannibacter diazotrophicus]